MNQAAKDLIERLGLVPHPEEGGYYRETYRSTESIAHESLPSRYPSARSFGTAIYYLLTDRSFSAMHRLRTDEVFHFYLGDSVSMLLLYPDGTSASVRLGLNIANGERPQFVVPRGSWFGSRLVDGGDFALLGTTMGPGFEFEDYEHGDFAQLAELYPDCVGEIRRLTR